jgi:glycosyltransferase involved in cell wall biosynthesis
MKPVIVHIVQHLQPGGIESFVLEFQSVAAAHFDVYIISLEKTNVQQYWQHMPLNLSFIKILNKKSGWQPNLVRLLAKMLRKLNPIYVHTHHIGPLIYGGLAAKLAKINNVIHTEHDAWHLAQNKRKLLQFLVLKLVKPIFVADAKFVADQVKVLMPSITPIVITNGVDVEKFQPSIVHKKCLKKAVKLPTHLRYVGCAARLEEVKAHDVLISAMTHLPEDVGLLLAGTGSLEKKLRALVITHKLQNRVFFLGHVEDMHHFYSLLDVFCLSSSNEGLPLSPMEAQACNVPAVLTDVGGCKEAICPHTGIIVKPNNPILLASAIKRCLQQNSEHSPRDFVINERSIKQMIRQYLSLIKPNLGDKLC